MKHIQQLGQKCLRLRPLHYIIIDFVVLARFWPQMIHIVWIWQEADIKHEVCIYRNTIFEAERSNIDGECAST
ncbi:hypothetical protein D3C81_2182220 [compost metagenome]